MTYVRMNHAMLLAGIARASGDLVKIEDEQLAAYVTGRGAARPATEEEIAGLSAPVQAAPVVEEQPAEEAAHEQ